MDYSTWAFYYQNGYQMAWAEASSENGEPFPVSGDDIARLVRG